MIEIVNREFRSIVSSFEFSLRIFGGNFNMARKLYDNARDRVREKCQELSSLGIAYYPVHLNAYFRIDKIYEDYLSRKV